MSTRIEQLTVAYRDAENWLNWLVEKQCKAVLPPSHQSRINIRMAQAELDRRQAMLLRAIEKENAK